MKHLFTRSLPAAWLSLSALLGSPLAWAADEPVAATKEAPAAAIAVQTVKPPAKDQFQIYLLMGQSNMAGRDRRKLDQQVDEPRVLALTPANEWVVARDPLHEQNGRTLPGAGPGLPFAKAMVKANPNVTIGLVPCAVGGTPLKRWVRNGDLYKRAIERAKLAQQYGTIAGVIWHQGESDSDNKVYSERYEKNLAQMLGDLRSDLGLPQLPIVVGEMGRFLLPEKQPYADTVRAAVKRMPELVPNVGYADSEGLTDQGDHLHFDADSAQQLGERYAKAMQKLQKPATAQALPVGTFKRLNAGEKQTIITYGTSLTIKGAWAGAAGTYFEKQYPGQVTFINAAKAGMHSDWGVANLQERVLSKKPDLVFIEFAINDAGIANNVSLEKAEANLDQMVKAIQAQNPNVDIVLQTMDLAWDSPRVPTKKYGSDRPNLHAYYDIYRRYAAEHHLPLVDNEPDWQKILTDDQARYEKMVPDGIHPSSTSSLAVTWPNVEALLEKSREAAK